MLTQEKKDIKNRLIALPKDELHEFISSLGVDSAAAADSSSQKATKPNNSPMTWAKFDNFMVLIAGGIALGTIFAGVRGAAVGGVFAVVYGWYILNDEVGHPHSPDKSC